MKAEAGILLVSIPITLTEREQVATLRAKGLSVRAIAEKLEISKSTAGRYVQEYEAKSKQSSMT
ncbi:helix-turn-helix domain-containing protein [Rothia sp. L_38]|uniref:helix-turn-helix domain-containing protein n=1 Tax=Rothia sp. L_38 TaxID=3422315 RepID=UPI003D6BE26B